MTKNLNCPVCNSIGLELGRPGFRTCPVSSCPVDRFKIRGERPPHPLEKKVEEFREFLIMFIPEAKGIINKYEEIFGVQ